MRSIRGGTLGWNIEIYSTPTNQFDWSVSRAYVINIYIYGQTRLHYPARLRARVKSVLNIFGEPGQIGSQLNIPACVAVILKPVALQKVLELERHGLH